MEESPSKKAKDAQPSAELYAHPSWEVLEMFDSEARLCPNQRACLHWPLLSSTAATRSRAWQDLDDDGIFMLLVSSAVPQLYVWVGADADPSVDPEGAGHSFLDDKGLQGASVTVVAQDEEPKEFWNYFLNG